MKIAISSSGENLESAMDIKFGRCPFFIIVDIKDKKIESSKAIKNSAMMQGGGAGIAAAQLVGNEGANAVIAANVGPRAFGILHQLGIAIYQGFQGTVRDNVQQFIEGKLKKLDTDTGPTAMDPQQGRFGEGQNSVKE